MLASIEEDMTKSNSAKRGPLYSHKVLNFSDVTLDAKNLYPSLSSLKKGKNL